MTTTEERLSELEDRVDRLERLFSPSRANYVRISGEICYVPGEHAGHCANNHWYTACEFHIGDVLPSCSMCGQQVYWSWIK